MTTVDLGTVLSLSGTAIHSSYVAGSTMYGGLPSAIRLSAVAVTIAGTNSTSVELEVMASEDGTNFYAVTSQDDEDEIIAPLKEHTYATGGGAGTLRMSLIVDGRYKFLQLNAKFTGGAGKAGESITAKALATK